MKSKSRNDDGTQRGLAARKLRFSRETLRSLAAAELVRVVGGAASACNAGCLTCNGSISCPRTK
jgi:hypothetical protein